MEQETHHPGTLSNVLLHQLASRHPDEPTIGMVRHCPRKEGLSRPRRSIKEYALGLSDTKGVKELGVLDGEFNHLLDFFDLLVQTADHFVSRVRDLFDHHEGDEGVLLCGEDRVELVCR